MAREPIMLGREQTNVPNEHVFKCRVTFGASSVSSYKCENGTFARSSAGTFTLTLPKPYAQLSDLSIAFKAATTAGKGAHVITDALSTTGVLTIETYTLATPGTPADPASGDVMYLTVGVTSSELNTRSQT